MDYREAILRTLIYADIFNYPLTKDEVWDYLISDKKLDYAGFNRMFNNQKLKQKDNYYYLSKSNVVKLRQDRMVESKRKMVIAQKYSRLISIIPTVKLIGVSGSLAIGNADKKADIDFFIICSKNRVWITRLMIIIFLILSGKYRSKKDVQVADKICLNMLISENLISFKTDRQDLFTAHEIIQMKPLFEREDQHRKFLNANNWVKKYLPNYKNQKAILTKKDNFVSLPVFSSIFEYIARKIQLKYMGQKKKGETITANFLAFHPNNQKAKVLTLYNRKLKQYSLL
jgi:hypothetical protein